MQNTPPVYLTVALYGIPETGFGWIAQLRLDGQTRMLGTGEPRTGVSKPQAIADATIEALADLPLGCTVHVEALYDAAEGRTESAGFTLAPGQALPELDLGKLSWAVHLHG